MNKPLLPEIDAFIAVTGMGEFRFGLLAAKNGRLVERLRSGGRVWPETEDLVRGFMRTELLRRAAKSEVAA